jgi:hypothetical protein
VRLVFILLPLFVSINYFSKCKLFSELQFNFSAKKSLGKNLSRAGIGKLTMRARRMQGIPRGMMRKPSHSVETPCRNPSGATYKFIITTTLIMSKPSINYDHYL